jgi:hypothetical protein
VRGGVQVMRDRRTAAAGAGVEEGEVDGDIGSGLCCDAGCDEVWVEAGVCAQCAEEEGLLGGGPLPCWQMEGRCVGWHGGFRRAGEVLMRSGNVGDEVLGVIGIGVEDGQEGGLQVLICIGHLWVHGVLEERK